MKLTVKRIERYVTRPGRYADGGRSGLVLQVISRTNASWIFRYQRGINPATGKPKEFWMGLGPLPLLTREFADALEEARGKAEQMRKLLRDGIDPIEARDAKKREQAEFAHRAAAVPTFKTAAEQCFKLLSPKWKNKKSPAQWRATMESYAYPKIGHLSVATVTADDVFKVIDPIWSRIPETANRLRGRIEQVFEWATAHKHLNGPNGAPIPNPARWEVLKHLLPARPQDADDDHHPALPFAEMPAFMANLRKREGVAAKALGHGAR
jgi:hypothetical protein